MDNDEVLRLLGRVEQADEAAFKELYRAFEVEVTTFELRNDLL